MSNSLLERLAADFSQLTFAPSDSNSWSARHQTIFFDAASDTPAELFHELGHALLGHSSFRRDIELIGMERDAWHEAAQLAKHYDYTIDDDTREDALDSYRDWLHARSLCPQCAQNGLQIASSQYQCFYCLARWRVNDARLCGMRRSIIAK